MNVKSRFCVDLIAALVGMTVLASNSVAAAPVFTTLATFSGANGNTSTAGLVFDLAGNLYGTTMFGGSGGGEFGQGVVFELSGADHTKLKTLVSFDGSNGAGPAAALTLDAFGNLFGTTTAGGSAGSGTAFRLSGPGHQTLTTEASFTGANGSGPVGGLALYAPGEIHAPGYPYFAGNLFGTTATGGTSGYGTVFKLSGPGHRLLTTVVSFAGTNGSQPNSTLVADAAGALYGTTFTGTGNYGTVFKLSGPNHDKLTTLVTFNLTNGANPRGGLTMDAAGNLYGTTQYGGPGYGGTIFELPGPNHNKLVTLATFGNNDPVGDVPQGTLLIDAMGNLFGTLNGGGDEFGGNGPFLGSVFKLSADHKTLTLLYAFQDNTDGLAPEAGLTADSEGNLYGTASYTVFKLSGAGFVPSPGPLSLSH